MKITFQSPPKNLDEKMLYNILRDYKMLNCEVLVRDENGEPVGRLDFFHGTWLNNWIATVDDFIDVIMKEHRKYIKWYVFDGWSCPCHQVLRVLTTSTSLYVYNKIDSVSLDFLDKLAREPDTVVMSCELDLGIHDVVERCWHELQLLRIYTKRWVADLLLLLLSLMMGKDRTKASVGKEKYPTSAKHSSYATTHLSKMFVTRFIEH